MLEGGLARHCAATVLLLRGEDLRLVASILEYISNRTADSSLSAASSSERESATASMRVDAGPTGPSAGSYGTPPEPKFKPWMYVKVGPAGAVARIVRVDRLPGGYVYGLDRYVDGLGFRTFDECELELAWKAE
jgi:hypothetical protein